MRLVETGLRDFDATTDPAASLTNHLTSHQVRASLGVPVYNGEAFLEETLDSLLAQTFGDFEVIVSDNASTDRTGEIARRFAARDARVRYHRQPQNLGLAANYNGLVQMSSGEFFKWATADDVCEPAFLERCVAALVENPDAVLAYPRTQFIDPGGRPLDIQDPGFPLHWSRAADRWRYVVGAEHWVNAVLGVIRRSALTRTRLLPSYRGGDYVLLGELCLLGRFLEVPDVLFLRRVHPEASSQIGSDEGKWLKFMTGRSGRSRFPEWQRVRDHLSTVARSELQLREKVPLLGALASRTWLRRKRLVGEVAGAFYAMLRTP